MNIIKYSEDFGLKLEEALKSLTEMEPLPRQLIEWFHLFILNDYVPALAGLERYLTTNDPRHLTLLMGLYEKVRDKWDNDSVVVISGRDKPDA